MSFYADLHIHSKYSRATSRDCDLENLTYWGRKKGITVIGTGDFTHPAWFKEIKEKLVPAEPGLFRLRPDLEKKITEKLPKSCHGTTRFMLSVEISTIYKKDDKVRKIHHLVYAPSIEKAEKIRTALEKIGNIRSDGRPILGLDSRHLLEIVLQAGEDCFIVPAHIWTPWFAVLGSKSGFDNVAHCYGDLADHIFAVETGLSSDPEMNWKVSSLDRYRLMSNSDAHSPQKLGREVNVFHTPLDYYSMRKSLQTGNGYGGTLEFFPEEGKYHMDGHRNCEIRFSPEESKRHNGICPKCKKPLTLGVLYRVEELADRKEHEKPKQTDPFASVIPLPEVISEIMDSGVASQTVQIQYEGLVQKLGAELDILNKLALDEIQKSSSSLIAEAITRMRKGDVLREAGYDGEYGRIKLFKKGELKKCGSAGVLFEVAPSEAPPKPKKEKLRKEKSKLSSPAPGIPAQPLPKKASEIMYGDFTALDEDQKKALEILQGPLLIMAGPGSGKTRTLTHRVAHLIQKGYAKPEECLTITFTRRAAQEVKERLQKLLPGTWKQVPVMTFHALGFLLLQENRSAAGLPRGFRISSEEERRDLLASKRNLSAAKAEKILKEISQEKRAVDSSKSKHPAAVKALEEARDNLGWLDFDDLILESIRLLEEDPGLRASYQKKFSFISIDEYQDVDELQYKLIRLLVSPQGNLCAIGDPDQAIYSFRGADVAFFMRFEIDFPGARKINLIRNYRSGESIISASNQMIAPCSLVEGREMTALLDDTGKINVHRAPTEKAEAEFVVHTIEKMLGGLSYFSIDSARTDGSEDQNFSFSDFAVLSRTEQQALSLEEAFERSGIPYERHSQKNLAQHPRIQSYLALIKNSPVKETLLDALHMAKKKLDESASLPHDTAYEKLEAIALKVKENRESFFSEIYLGEDLELWDSRADRVSLLTLHAAKGLEFPVVFITGCENGLLPLQWSDKISEEALAEERRLFYVGMTRAKVRLFLSHAEKRFHQGKPREREISPFLKDIEKKLLELSKSKHKRKIKTPQMELFS